jgi:hypothetical protein
MVTNKRAGRLETFLVLDGQTVEERVLAETRLQLLDLLFKSAQLVVFAWQIIEEMFSAGAIVEIEQVPTTLPFIGRARLCAETAASSGRRG